MWTGFSAIGIHSDTQLQCGMEGVGSKQLRFGVFSPLGEKKKKNQIMLPALQFTDTYPENQKTPPTKKQTQPSTL